MSPFYMVFLAVFMLTCISGTLATYITFKGDPENNSSQKSLADNLINMFMLGAGAIIGLLGGVAIPV